MTFSRCQAGQVVPEQHGDLGVEAHGHERARAGGAAGLVRSSRALPCAAWRPAVPGIIEVFHARFTDHAYPEHTHDTWTLLIVDEGAIRYDLDRHEHGALRTGVTLLPPHVAHDGRSATRTASASGCCTSTPTVLDPALVGAAVDTPEPRDSAAAHARPPAAPRAGRARRRARGGEPAGAGRASGSGSTCGGPAPRLSPDRLAAELRDLLDARMVDGLALREAAALLHAHPRTWCGSFTRAFGLPPHRYLTGRRVEAARCLLLAGEPVAQVATAAGFHDQSHLTRHFTPLVGTTPGRYGGASYISKRSKSPPGWSPRNS